MLTQNWALDEIVVLHDDLMSFCGELGDMVDVVDDESHELPAFAGEALLSAIRASGPGKIDLCLDK